MLLFFGRPTRRFSVVTSSTLDNGSGTLLTLDSDRFGVSSLMMDSVERLVLGGRPLGRFFTTSLDGGVSAELSSRMVVLRSRDVAVVVVSTLSSSSSSSSSSVSRARARLRRRISDSSSPTTTTSRSLRSKEELAKPLLLETKKKQKRGFHVKVKEIPAILPTPPPTTTVTEEKSVIVVSSSSPHSRRQQQQRLPQTTNDEDYGDDKEEPRCSNYAEAAQRRRLRRCLLNLPEPSVKMAEICFDAKHDAALLYRAIESDGVCDIAIWKRLREERLDLFFDFDTRTMMQRVRQMASGIVQSNFRRNNANALETLREIVEAEKEATQNI